MEDKCLLIVGLAFFYFGTISVWACLIGSLSSLIGSEVVKSSGTRGRLLAFKFWFIQRGMHGKVSDVKPQGPWLTTSSKVLYLFYIFENLHFTSERGYHYCKTKLRDSTKHGSKLGSTTYWLWDLGLAYLSAVCLHFSMCKWNKAGNLHHSIFLKIE